MVDNKQTSNKKIAVIVIPTYNEAGNIGLLIDEIYRLVVPKVPNWQIKMLVVDAASPDGTASIVRERARIVDDVYLLEEKGKEGIGAAYCRGAKHAVDILHADVIVEFDADFQHPPECIPKMLVEIDNGYDYVLASRLTEGGRDVSEGRGVSRKGLTRFGGLLARVILFFPSKFFKIVTDPTSGLKATRVKGFIDQLDLDPNNLYSKNFGYKVEWLSKILHFGAKYKEIPLVFASRRDGKSKFKASVIIDILLSCIKTRVSR